MRTYETAAKRWAGVGPYYAMFPVGFADRVVEQYTDPGDVVLDPFAGRGTAVFSAAVQGRCGIGIELHPVGWLYSRTKLSVASKRDVLARCKDIALRSTAFADEARALPRFFHRCFSTRVRRFLLAARSDLNWRRNKLDRTVMALLLVNLHGKRDSSFSNQMRQAKAMAPDYSIAWWEERGLEPPDVDPVAFMEDKLSWRYAKGRPQTERSYAYFGDNLRVLQRLKSQWPASKRARLLFTSPPYFSRTNYHYDQWLRLWLLGGAPNALRIGGVHRGKFEHPERYRQLLLTSFRRAAACLHRDAIVYVRTGRDKFTRTATRDALRAVFPKKAMREDLRPFKNPTQTDLFGDAPENGGEVDFLLRPS